MARARKTNKKKKSVWKWVLSIGGGIILVLTIVLVALWWNEEGSKSDLERRGLENRGLPVMEIKLSGVTIDEIDEGDKDTRYEGNEAVIYEDGKANELDAVMIKGRGNGSWMREKKSYRITTEGKTDLLGLGRAKKWNLLANAADDTFLRNEAALDLQKYLEMKYPFEGRFMELYVNDDYRGLYYLTRAVGIDKDLVDLRDQLGVLMELDNYYMETEDGYMAKNGDYFVIKDLVSKEKKQIAVDEFLENYNELTEAIKNKDYNRVEELIDVESFAKYFLLSEFSVNPDAYWTSFYMYKDGVNDKIHAGPGWDFDLAFGNHNWGNWLGERFYSPRETTIRREELLPKEFYDKNGIERGYERSQLISTLLFDLMDFPEFKNEVVSIFREKMLNRENELINDLIMQSEKIYTVAKMDGEMWERNDFEEEMSGLVKWIRERYKYFVEIYGDFEFVRKEVI